MPRRPTSTPWCAYIRAGRRWDRPRRTWWSPGRGEFPTRSATRLAPHPLCCRPGRASSRIFGNQPGFIVSCIGARAFVLNDEAAFVVGTERMPGGEMACTNVFCVEDGEWRIANHMGGQGRGLKSTEEDAEKLGLDLQRLPLGCERLAVLLSVWGQS